MIHNALPVTYFCPALATAAFKRLHPLTVEITRFPRTCLVMRAIRSTCVKLTSGSQGSSIKSLQTRSAYGKRCRAQVW